MQNKGNKIMLYTHEQLEALEKFGVIGGMRFLIMKTKSCMDFVIAHLMMQRTMQQI